MELRFADKVVDFSKPRIMGVCNITPDSFYSGSRYFADSKAQLDRVLVEAERMVRDGADFIDIGGESTRPGASPVSEQEELDRVIPIIEAIALEVDTVVSVDTSTPLVMRDAVAAGAGLINDVRALRREGALQAAGQAGIPVCLMHMQGSPQTMQTSPSYKDVVIEVNNFLQERVDACVAAGINKQNLLLDPGFGFGKSDEHNLHLLANLGEIGAGEFPLIAGLSRKSLLGRLLGRKPEDRLAGSLALALKAAIAGAHILRVHDVAETVDVLKIFKLVDDNLN